MKWRSYEEVATYLLNYFADRFSLDRVEGKQQVQGKRSGTDWEIDAKGVCLGGEGFMIVECRRYIKLKQTQEKVGGLAYKIIDTGAKGGIVVSPLGIQAGAALVASAENILEVKIDPNSTPTDFALQFLGRMMIGAGIIEQAKVSVTCSAEVIRTCSGCCERFQVEQNESECPKCGRNGGS